MSKRILLEVLRARNASFGRGAAASCRETHDQFPWVAFTDEFWRNEIASREALDAVRVRRYWRIQIDDSELVLFGTNAQVIARALILFPTPTNILVRPCTGRKSGTAAPHLFVPNWGESYEYSYLI